MRLPLRLQIFLPFGLLSVIAVVAITAGSAVVAARLRQAESLSRLRSVVETLRTSQFPATSTVLEQMHGLSSAEFIVRDADGRVLVATLDPPPPDTIEAGGDILDRLTDLPSIPIGSDRYFAAEVPLASRGAGEVLQVLLPLRAWRQLIWEAALPPIVAGAATSAAVLLVAGWLAGRLTRRLDMIRSQVTRIAAGVSDSLPTNGPDDELRDLAEDVNSLSEQLRLHERTVRQTERMRLVAQLSSGLAHQLRNAASGARLAIQLVQRRHPAVANRELDVAMTQMELIEDHIRRLLSVGSDSQRPTRVGTVADVMRSVEDLVSPSSRHAGVVMHFESKTNTAMAISDFDGVRSGLLNVVMNGLDAAGPGGKVDVAAEHVDGQIRMTVTDSGPGPDPSVADRIFEPFVTTKPEGIGLGLAYVRRTVESLGGAICWEREANATRFVLLLPVS
jgi:signal transduction histidine kinase